MQLSIAKHRHRTNAINMRVLHHPLLPRHLMSSVKQLPTHKIKDPCASHKPLPQQAQRRYQWALGQHKTLMFNRTMRTHALEDAGRWLQTRVGWQARLQTRLLQTSLGADMPTHTHTHTQLRHGHGHSLPAGSAACHATLPPTHTLPLPCTHTRMRLPHDTSLPPTTPTQMHTLSTLSALVALRLRSGCFFQGHQPWPLVKE
jgi:hypothetical protein